MRIESPYSSISGKLRGGSSIDGLPCVGGKPRILYDYLVQRKAVPISNKELKSACGLTSSSLWIVADQLQNFWGLDIRSVPDRYHKCLVGEWVGDKYVDYIAEKIKD